MSERRSILATKSVLAVILSRETPFLDDEIRSRHRFEVKNARFWRRGLFSSPFLVENLSILATSLVLVAIFGWELLNFDDEPRSRRPFWVGITQF